MISTQSTQRQQGFTKKKCNLLSAKIIECGTEVHKELGPRLMESVFENCDENVMRKDNVPLLKEVSEEKLTAT